MNGTRRTPAPAIQAAAAALLLAATAAAAQSSPYRIGLSQAYTRDNNVLLLADGESAPAGYSRADRIATTSLLAGFDQPFGRQRAYADVAVRRNQYDENAIFDNTSYHGVIGLDWSTINRIQGTLSALAARNLQRFASPEVGFLGERNLETLQQFNAGVYVGLVTRYTLELTGGHREVENSLQRPAVQANAHEQDEASVGLRWRPRAGSSFGLRVGAARGRFPFFRNVAPAGADPVYEADSYRRRNVELFATLEVGSPGTELEFAL